MGSIHEEGNEEATAPNQLLLDALTARFTAVLDQRLDQRFENFRDELVNSDQGRSRRSRNHSETENYYSHSSRSNGARRRRHDNEERRPRPTDPISSLKLKIPEFKGTSNPEEYLEWEKKLEIVFECKEYTQDQKLKLAPTEFKDYALSWWDQLVTNRRRVGDLPIDSWSQLKTIMRRRFVPNHYHRELHLRLRTSSQEENPKTCFSSSRFSSSRINPSKDDRSSATRESKPIPKPKIEAPSLKDKKTVLAPLTLQGVHLDQTTLHKNKTHSEPRCKQPTDLTQPQGSQFPLSSIQSDFVHDKLTHSEPVQPSSLVSVSQVIEEEPKEESLGETQRSLFLVNDLEQPTQFVSEPAHIPFPCDYPRKHCKEIDLVRTESNLFMLISAQEEKRFGLENVKELRVSKSVFDKIILSFETVRSEEFFKPKGFICEKVHELESSLRVSLSSKACDLSRTRTECATVKSFSKLNQMPENMFCASNFITFSSIMHMFFAMRVEKGTGAMKKHKYLGAGDTQNIMAIKGKPPDSQQLQSICKESKQGIMSEIKDAPRENVVVIQNQGGELMCYIQLKENPPDLCKQKTYHSEVWNWKYLRKTTSITQGCPMLKLCLENNYLTIYFIFLFVPKLFPFDVGDLVYVQFEPTNQEHGNVKASSSLLKDKPSDPTPTFLMITSSAHIKNLIQISNSLTLLVYHMLGTVIMSPLHSDCVDKKLGLFKECLEPDSCPRKEEPEKDNMIQAETCLIGNSDSMTVIMHLLFAKGVDNIAGTIEEPLKIDDPLKIVFMRTGIGDTMVQAERESKLISSSFNLTRRICNKTHELEVSILVFKSPFIPDQTDMIRLSLPKEPTVGFGACLKRPRRTIGRGEDNRFKPPDLDQDKHKDVRCFILLKEAPPDATYKFKLMARTDGPFKIVKKINDNAYQLDLQGKYSVSSSFKVTDLASLCAGKTDLRSNPFQEGGDDMIMASSEDKEAKDQEAHTDKELTGAKEQLKELNEAKEQDQEQLGAEEDLAIPPGVMTRSKAHKFHQAFHKLLISIQGNFESANPITLIVIQAA